jgi:hypothetical protein
VREREVFVVGGDRDTVKDPGSPRRVRLGALVTQVWAEEKVSGTIVRGLLVRMASGPEGRRQVEPLRHAIYLRLARVGFDLGSHSDTLDPIRVG